MIHVIPEANMSFINADRVASIVSEMACGDCEVVRFMQPNGKADPRGRFGVVTTEHRKALYVNEMRHALRHNNLRFLAPQETIGSNVERDLGALRAQLNSYKEEIIPGDEYGTTPPKRRYSGKGTGQKDDLCLAIQIVMYWSLVYGFRSAQTMTSGH
jgi:hypothetical protein